MDELYIDNLSGIEFESYLFNLFKNLGYEVENTPASNDYGADLIISKDTERIVVQAKRYNSTVGIAAIQEVIGAKNYYEANKCMVVTNNYFTPNAIELAKANNVELWDRKVLIEKAILSVNPNFNIDSTENTQDDKNNVLYNINDADELLPEAINLVIKEEQASISLLQRKLRIGYARAACLIDEMEEMGIVGGFEGSKPRKVLIDKDTLEDSKPRKILIDEDSLQINSYETNPYEKYKDLESQTQSKPKLSLKHKIFRLFISLLIMIITWFIAALNIENALVGSITLIILIFISFAIGNQITIKLFSK